MKNDHTTVDQDILATSANLKPLVEPLAAYVAAATDPKLALGEILTLLVVETKAIEAAAQCYLEPKRHRHQMGIVHRDR